MSTISGNIGLKALEEMQRKALDAAISKAKESGIFKTPDYFLWLWLEESARKNEFPNLYFDKANEEFRIRLTSGRYIDPARWMLKGRNKKRLENYYQKFGTSTSLLGSTPNARYYRARMVVINDLINQLEKDDPGRVLLRGGVFPDYIDQKGLIKELIYEKNISDKELSFQEVTSYNTWFNMHPEKVAGKEQISSSREFPITIKGSKEDIIQTIQQGMNTSETKFEFTVQLKKKAAKAKLKLLSI